MDLSASDSYLAFRDHFSGASINLETCKAAAGDMRWDVIAAASLDEAHYDDYMADIGDALRDFALAQYEARQHFKATKGKGVVGHHVRQQMRFHRAKLQEVKARAFAFAFNQQQKEAQ